jgi:hypothetical protein
MHSTQLPEEIAARLNRPMPWWKLLDCPELSGTELITRQASGFAQKLAKFRIAVVPDPRIDAGGIKGDTLCLALRVSSCNRHVQPDYEAAKQQLRRDIAFLMVKGRPSPRELNWVRTKGFEMFRLDSESRERLMALLEIMLQEPMENPEATVRATGLDKGIVWRGDQLARYRALCESDGALDELEQEALKMVTVGGGSTSRRQLSIFDEPASGSDQPEPVRAPRPATPAPAAANRSKSAAAPAPKTLALMLDASRIADISQQTSAVGVLLGDVFKDEDLATAVAAAPAPELTARIVPAPGVVPWRAALALARTRTSWPAADLMAAWSAAGWMAQAMADELNERALDVYGELLLEGDDVFDVNAAAAQALAEAP